MVVSGNKSSHNRGFTYIELMTGISIILLGFSFFIISMRYFSINKESVKVSNKMTTIAQNVAIIYSKDVLLTQIKKDYPEYDISVTDIPIPAHLNMIKRTIEVKQNTTYKNQDVAPYVLVYCKSNNVQ